MEEGQKMKKTLFIIVFALFSIAWVFLYADQVIYVESSSFDKSLSQFGVEVKGNKWVETVEKGAINGTALGGPGDNNHSADGGEPYIVIKLPVKVKAGESTADKKVWAAWARLYEPQAIIDATNYNSFFLRTSADAKNWTPATRGDTSLRWNDPGAMFPDSVNGVDILFTDVGKAMPWFWQKHSANGQSTIDPVLAVGDNYIEIGIRESDPVNYPRIDVICLRNDGKQPSDKEVPQYLSPVSPGGKLTWTWGRVKSLR